MIDLKRTVTLSRMSKHDLERLVLQLEQEADWLAAKLNEFGGVNRDKQSKIDWREIAKISVCKGDSGGV